jgi:hypothetical protein
MVHFPGCFVRFGAPPAGKVGVKGNVSRNRSGTACQSTSLIITKTVSAAG